MGLCFCGWLTPLLLSGFALFRSLSFFVPHLVPLNTRRDQNVSMFLAFYDIL